MTTDLDQTTAALTTQWKRLHAWLSPLGDNLRGARNKPSVLEVWTSGELVAHLARTMGAIDACTPAPPGTVPLTLAEYLATYPAGAENIAATTRELAEEIADSPLAETAVRVERSLALLRGLGTDGDLVVQARRGPISLRDLVMSRLFELVVHGHDLVASLTGVADATGPNNPVDRQAERIVAEELLDIVVTRGGWALEITDPRLWVLIACGRVPYNVDTLARAIAPQYTAGGVPDLGRVLPLL